MVAFSAIVLPGDHLITTYLSSDHRRLCSHKDMHKFFVVSLMPTNGTARNFQYFFFSIWVEPQRLLVYSFGKSLLDYGEGAVRLPRVFVLGRLRGRPFLYATSYVRGILPSVGVTGSSPCSVLTLCPTTNVLGGGAQVPQQLNFMIDTVRETFGESKTKLNIVEAAARRLINNSRGNARGVPSKVLASFVRWT